MKAKRHVKPKQRKQAGAEWYLHGQITLSSTDGKTRVDAVGFELVVHSDDAREMQWYCSEMYLQTGMFIYGNIT